MKFVQRNATTSKSEHIVKNFNKLKSANLTTAVTMKEIPPMLTLNWDQTRIQLVPSSSYTMDKQGVKKQVEMVGVNNKRQITAIFVVVCLVIPYLYNN